MKRYYLLFKGRVQGVGFRWTLYNIADKNKLTGWCRNLDNGDVDAEIQGEDNYINQFLKEVLNTKGFIRIDDYAIKQIPLNNEEKTFECKY